MIVKCPVCWKVFDVPWPDLWAYKRRNGGTGSNYFYFCSWKCLRTLEKKGDVRKVGARTIISQAQRDHAVQLAISREDPRPYLTQCGCKNAAQMWSKIRMDLKDSDPKTFAQLPKVIGHKSRKKTAEEAKPNDADEFAVECEEITMKVNEGKPKICRPVNYDGFEFGSAKSTETGFRYEYSAEYDLFSIKAKGDEMAICLEDLRALIRELPKAAAVLGVEL